MSQMRVYPDSKSALVGWDRREVTISAERLSPEEQEWFEASGYIVVYNPCKLRNAYRIWWDGSVYLYKGATLLAELYLPGAESLSPGKPLPLILKVLIETNEQRFLEMAQSFPPGKESSRDFDVPGVGL